MSVWKLPDRTPFSGSHWKPVNAGEMNMRCEFELPKPDGSTIISDNGNLRLKVTLQAGYDHKDTGAFIPYWGQGITDIRVALIRGSQVWWSGIGWISLDALMVNSFSTIRIDELFTDTDSDGNTALIIEQAFPVSGLGAGDLRVQVYMESHPRNVPPKPNIGFNPRLAGLFSQYFRIDGTPPETVIHHVTNRGNSPLVIGSASDNMGVKQVFLTLKDQYTELFWSDTLGEWAPSAVQNKVNVHPQGGWFWSFPEAANPGSGVYEVSAYAEDLAERPRTRDNKLGYGHFDPTPAVATIKRTLAKPIIKITSPSSGEILATGDRISGNAFDDGAIDTLTLSIRDREHNRFWNPITRVWDSALSEMSEPRLILADEVSHSPQDEWSYAWRANFIEPQGGSGLYEINLKATDLAGNMGVASLDVLGSIDGIRPTVSITFPLPDAVLVASQDVGALLTIIGMVEDDRATPISTVQLAIQDTNTGSWWNMQNNSWQSNRIDEAAYWLDPPDENMTRFSETRFRPFTTANPGSGNYRILARPIDGAGNIGAEVSRTFSIVLDSQ